LIKLKKEFIVWYSTAKKENTRALRVEKMKQMLSAGKVLLARVTKFLDRLFGAFQRAG